MRNHPQVIRDAGGATDTAEKLFPLMPVGRWATVKDLANTVQGWVRAGSIPPEYWPAFVTLALAELTELTQAIADSRLPGQVARVVDAEAVAP